MSVSTTGGTPLNVEQRFEILSTLGQGGAAKVLRVRERASKKEFALKVLLSLDPNEKRRLLREARTMMALQGTSRHILRVFETGETTDGQGYILMELAPGGSLSAHLQTRGKLSAAEAVLFVYEACIALQPLHARGRVHRDVKPGNLLFADSKTILVSDFGIVTGDSAQEQTRLTRTGVGVGTLSYMPFEQMTGRQAHPTMDVYALCVTLYQLLCGQVPLEDAETTNDPGAFARKRIQERGNYDPRSVQPDVPDAVAEIVIKGTNSDPEQRFQNAGELAAALEPNLPSGRFATGLIELRHALPKLKVWEQPWFKWVKRGAAALAIVCAVALAVWLSARTEPIEEFLVRASALEFDAQVEAVLKRLAKDNPGFNAKLARVDASKAELVLNGAKIENTVPLKALTAVKRLHLRDCGLRNYEILAGLKLEMLDVTGNPGGEFQPLANIQTLRELWCNGDPSMAVEGAFQRHGGRIFAAPPKEQLIPPSSGK